MFFASKVAVTALVILEFSAWAAAAQPERALLPMPIESAPASRSEFTWSLPNLTDQAERMHPELEQARRDIQAAQGRAVQAGLYPNPVLASASPQWAGSNSQYNVFTSQEFVTANKLTLAQQAALREVDQARFQWQAIRLRIVAGVRRDAFTTIAAQRRVGLQTELMGIVRQSRDIAKILLEGGEGTRADVLLLDIDYDRARMAVQNLQTELEVARRRLAYSVGDPRLPIDAVEGDLTIAIPAANLDSLRLYVAQTHPEMSVARLEIPRSQFLLRRAEVQPIPNLNLMGGYQRQVGPPQDQGLFQATIEVPLFNRNQGNIRAAQADLARARAGVRTAELDLSQRVAEAYNSFTVSAQRAKIYEEQLRPKAQQTFRIARDLYEQGQIDFLRLLQSQRTLIETELGYLDVLQARLLAATELAALVQWNDFPNGSPPMPVR